MNQLTGTTKIPRMCRVSKLGGLTIVSYVKRNLPSTAQWSTISGKLVVIKLSSAFCSELFIQNYFTDRKHGERKQIGTLPESNIPTKDQSSDLIKCEWCSEVSFVTISKAIEHKFRKHRYESTNYFCSDCGKLFPLKVISKRFYIIQRGR